MLKKCELNKLIAFFERVDGTFPIPLSQKRDLKMLALKLIENGTTFVFEVDNQIYGLVAGYTNKEIGYISVVAVDQQYQGNGIAKKLIREFLDYSREMRLHAIHLYCDRHNLIAINLYYGLGFKKLLIKNEQRPEDLHLIYYLSN